MYEKIKKYILNELSLDESVLEKNKNLKYGNIDEEVREKILVYNTYYNFIEYPECIKIIEKIKNAIEEKYKEKYHEESMTISIILLKSFLDKKVYNTTEKFINSDDIFNYMVDQYQKYLLIKKIYVPEKQIQTIILHILDLVNNKNIISSKIINVMGGYLKTHKYYSLIVDSYLNITTDFFSFSLIDFKLIEYNDKLFITTVHYSKTHELNKKNFKSDQYFKIKNISYIMKKINVRLKVDKEFQLMLKNKNENEIGVLKEKIKNYFEILNLHYEKEL
jgi:hypothetical protein